MAPIRRSNLTIQPRVPQPLPYFGLEIQLYVVLLELHKQQLDSKPAEIQLVTLFSQIRRNARVAGLKLGPRMKPCVLKHLIVAEKNQLLNFKASNCKVFSFTHYGHHMLANRPVSGLIRFHSDFTLRFQKHLTCIDAVSLQREKLRVTMSILKTKLSALNLRPALTPIQIQFLRIAISKYLEKEEYNHLINLESLINAESGSTFAIHLNNERLREIPREYGHIDAEIKRREAEILLSYPILTTTAHQTHDFDAELVALRTAQRDLKREYNLVWLHVERLKNTNTLRRDGQHRARIDADIIRQAAVQMEDYPDQL
ncbi:hypothetical protein C8R43DRAFT_955175 [Mycena crocata]|nr:hypothetical protein C8R43DRAFT_955175 [Mycena crocata]